MIIKKEERAFGDLQKCYAQTYTSQAWIDREKLFLSCCQLVDLKLNFDSESFFIKELLYRLDIIYTQAKLDLATVSKKLELYNNTIDEEIKIKAFEAKNNGIAKSDTAAKAYAIKLLKQSSATGSKKGKSLYECKNILAERYAFLSQITELIKMKQQMLITESAMLKLEASLIQ